MCTSQFVSKDIKLIVSLHVYFDCILGLIFFGIIFISVDISLYASLLVFDNQIAQISLKKYIHALPL